MVKYFVIDVDGTMTDAGIYYDSDGNEIKKFCTKDAAAFFIAKELGIQIIVLTGRKSLATERRMKELKVENLFQGITDKALFLRKYMEDNDIKESEMGYIGDDLNDLDAMSIVSFVGCPGDSCIEVKNIASYVSPYNGGHGAVRDIIEHYLRGVNEWEETVSKVYGVGI